MFYPLTHTNLRTPLGLFNTICYRLLLRCSLSSSTHSGGGYHLLHGSMRLRTSGHSRLIGPSLWIHTVYAILLCNRSAYSMAWILLYVRTHTILYRNRNPCSPNNTSSRTAVCLMYLLTWVSTECIHMWIAAVRLCILLGNSRCDYMYYISRRWDYTYTYSRDNTPLCLVLLLHYTDSNLFITGYFCSLNLPNLHLFAYTIHWSLLLLLLLNNSVAPIL